MSTADRRHCLMCNTWWVIEDEDSPRECPYCQEHGTSAVEPCRQPGCPWQRDHDYGMHELTSIATRSGYTVELGDQRFTQAQWEAVQTYIAGSPRKAKRAPLELDKPRVQWEDDARDRRRWWQR